MELMISREALKTVVGIAGGLAKPRGVRAILRNLCLAAGSFGLRIRAGDGESELRWNLPAEMQKAGTEAGTWSGLVPADVLMDVLACATGDNVLLRCAPGKLTVIECGTFFPDEWEVLTSPGDDYPDFSAALAESEHGTEVSAEELAIGLKRTLPFIGRDQGRYAINGVCFHLFEKKIDMAGTDGSRLAISEIAVEKEASIEWRAVEVIVPAGAGKLLLKLCAAFGSLGASGGFEISVIGRHLVVRAGGVEMSSLLVEGNYPKYKQVIPMGLAKSAVCPREALLSALAKAAVMTSEAQYAVDLSFNESGCDVRGAAADLGKSLAGIQCEYKGEPVTIGVSPAYLMEALKVLDDEKVNLLMDDKRRPLVLTAKRFTYVLMPVNPKE